MNSSKISQTYLHWFINLSHYFSSEKLWVKKVLLFLWRRYLSRIWLKVKERRGEREGGKEGRKNAKSGNKSNIQLKWSNFRYYRNCCQDFVNKLHINAAKDTYSQTSSDKTPLELKWITRCISEQWWYWIKLKSDSTAFERWDLLFQDTRSGNCHHA